MYIKHVWILDKMYDLMSQSFQLDLKSHWKEIKVWKIQAFHLASYHGHLSGLLDSSS